MGIKLGIGIFWRDMTYEENVSTIEMCEYLGYDSLWAINEKFYRDMYVQATVIAEHTKYPTIGTFVADPYTHHPALTAMSIGTLDEVSHGRAILCLGAGGTGFPAMGLRRIKPAEAIREAIIVIRGLLQGDVVDFQGEVIQFNKSHLNFKARPDIPILVASRGDLVLKTAGMVADGVMIATYAEPVGVQAALNLVKKGAEQVGRRLEDLTLISRVDVSISDDRRKALEAVKPMVAVMLWTSYPDRTFVHRVGLEVPTELEKIIAKRDYNLLAVNANLVPDSFVEKFCWAGTAEEVASKVARVAKLGVHHFTILPHALPGERVDETIRAFALEVRPKVEKILGASLE